MNNYFIIHKGMVLIDFELKIKKKSGNFGAKLKLRDVKQKLNLKINSIKEF